MDLPENGDVEKAEMLYMSVDMRDPGGSLVAGSSKAVAQVELVVEVGQTHQMKSYFQLAAVRQAEVHISFRQMGGHSRVKRTGLHSKPEGELYSEELGNPPPGRGARRTHQMLLQRLPEELTAQTSAEAIP